MLGLMHLEELAAEHEPLFLAMTAEADPSRDDFFGQSKAWTPAIFQKFVKETQKLRLDWRPGPNKVSVTHYVMREKGGPICASGLMRFPLDEKTTEIDGGNLVCYVSPSLRQRGYGSYCMSLMLFEAVRAGLSRVLVTCLASDKWARRMIEKNRGTPQDTVESKSRKGEKIARYWINFR